MIKISSVGIPNKDMGGGGTKRRLWKKLVIIYIREKRSC